MGKKSFNSTLTFGDLFSAHYMSIKLIKVDEFYILGTAI